MHDETRNSPAGAAAPAPSADALGSGSARPKGERGKIDGPPNPAASARREMAQAKAARPRRGVRQQLLDLYGWLTLYDRVFRPVLLACVAVSVGLLVAPDLRLRAYPTEDALVGTPVTENIKAPYDLEVVDEKTTERLRQDAAAQVRPVFDFDAEAAVRRTEQLSRAFQLARERAAQGPAQLAASRGKVEQILGAKLGDGQWRLLGGCHFAPALEAALIQVLTEAMMDPVAPTLAAAADEEDGSFGSSADGGKNGLVLQRVPPLVVAATKLGSAGAKSVAPNHQVVDDIASLTHLEAARAQAREAAKALFAPTGPLAGLAARGQQAELLRLFVTLTQQLIAPNISFNRAETELARSEARASIKPVGVAMKKGEMIIRDGERLTARHLMILRGIRLEGQSNNVLMMVLGGTVLLLLLCLLAGKLTCFLRRDIARLQARDLLFLAALFLSSLCLARVWLLVSRGLHEIFAGIPWEVGLFALPVAFAAMVVRLVLRQELALMFCVLHSLTLGLLADGDRLLSLYALCGSVAAVGAIGTISSRSDLFRAGAYAGVVQMVAALGVQLFAASPAPLGYLWAVPAALGGGVFASVLALSVTPAVEWAFDYTTDLKLLELANLNHPALKELIVQAPGSYHHSIIVGALVEAAAENIGANPLLARVMAYYHDLGKGCNPAYFIENQRSGQNPHDKLKPSMSAMVIRRHVTDGIQLAKRHGLGEQILAGIAQHHGNTLIHFFYHKAREMAQPDEVVSEADYRYPGTKPQTREAALVMLGDSIEAASRALAEPNAARLQGLTQRIINSKFTDGQLEECDLTLRDLHTIAKSFSLVLTSIYHHRLEYPELAPDGKKGPPRHDSDTKSPNRTEGGHEAAESHPKPDLRRLGLS